MALPTEPRQRGIAIAQIIVGVFALVGAVVATVLLVLCIEEAAIIEGYHHSFYSGYYCTGLIITGILTICAGATNARGVNIANLVLSIIVLIIYGLYIIGLIVACSDNETECELEYVNCKRVMGLARGGLAVLIITWILTLVGCCLSGPTSCRSQQHTVILHQGPTTTVVCSTNTTTAMGQQRGNPYIAPDYNYPAGPPQQASGYNPYAYAAQAPENPPPYMTSSDKAQLTRSAY